APSVSYSLNQAGTLFLFVVAAVARIASWTVMKPSPSRSSFSNSSMLPPLSFHSDRAICPSSSVSYALNQGGRLLGRLGARERGSLLVRAPRPRSSRGLPPKGPKLPEVTPLRVVPV